MGYPSRPGEALPSPRGYSAILGATMPEEERPREVFTEDELTAIARMLTVMIRVDGRGSVAEHEAVRTFAARVRLASAAGPDETPYRSAPNDADAAVGMTVLRPYLDRAAEVAVGREEFLRAARAIIEPDSREAVYAALFDVAAADVIVPPEWELLEALAEAWGLESAT